jgi:hypothetical protein
MSLQPLPSPWPYEPVRIPAPGLDLAVSKILDLLDELADPTYLDVVNEALQVVSRLRIGDRPRAKIDHHDLNAPQGHKSSLQATEHFDDLLRVWVSASLAKLPPGYLELFEEVERLRRQILAVAAPHLGSPTLLVGPQSVRLIRYRQGRHQPQLKHVDPPVRVALLLPPGDDRLVVEMPSGGPKIVRAFAEVATIVIFEGAQAAKLGVGIVPTPHSVRALEPSATQRDVATVFVYHDVSAGE